MRILLIIFTTLPLLFGCSKQTIIVHNCKQCSENNVPEGINDFDVAIEYLKENNFTDLNLFSEAFWSCENRNYSSFKYDANVDKGKVNGVICCSAQSLQCTIEEFRWLRS